MNLAWMSEGEVSLRLAFWAVQRGGASGQVEVAIDGAQVRTGTRVHFDPVSFLETYGWKAIGSLNDFRGEFGHAEWTCRLQVHSTPGRGDVVAKLSSGTTLRAECKKGPLQPSASSKEYPLIREALGQLLTVDAVDPSDMLVVAVPYSSKFESLAAKWRDAPLVARFGIRIATVHRTGEVFGLHGAARSNTYEATGCQRQKRGRTSVFRCRRVFGSVTRSRLGFAWMQGLRPCTKHLWRVTARDDREPSRIASTALTIPQP